jgi:hypothetical protein
MRQRAAKVDRSLMTHTTTTAGAADYLDLWHKREQLRENVGYRKPALIVEAQPKTELAITKAELKKEQEEKPVVSIPIRGRTASEAKNLPIKPLRKRVELFGKPKTTSSFKRIGSSVHDTQSLSPLLTYATNTDELRFGLGATAPRTSFLNFPESRIAAALNNEPNFISIPDATIGSGSPFTNTSVTTSTTIIGALTGTSGSSSPFDNTNTSPG